MIDRFKKSNFSGMKKLGESKEATYPEGFSEGALSWSNLAREIVGNLSDAWFANYGPVPLSESLGNNALSYSKPFVETFAPFLFGDNEVNVFPSFKTSFDELGSQQKIDESPLGKKLIETLAGVGINWFWEDTEPVTPFEYIKVPDAHMEGIAQWGSYFGMPIQQRFRVYKDKNNKEFIVWFCAALAATRPFEHLAERDIWGNNGEIEKVEIPKSDLGKGALTFGQWSTQLFIPAVIKRLFYLSETPYPSNIMNFPRTSAYKDVPEDKLPKPIFMHEKDERVTGAFETSQGSNQVSAAQMPDVIYMGWSFDADDFETQKEILSTITDGLVRINSFLEDGYLNFSAVEFSYPWSDALSSPVIFDFKTSQSNLGLAQWVPAVRLGILLNESNVRSAKAFELDGQNKANEARKEFEWVALDGAGMFVPNCSNSLVFSWLIKEKNWEQIDRVLEASMLLKYGDQSTNAISNWGIAKYKQGLVDEAVERFELALEQPDGFAESEASFWLAKIWMERGDSDKAAKYQARCDAAGGYESDPEAPEEPAPTGLSKTSPGLGLGGGSKISDSTPATPEPTSKGLAKFCANCGSGFATDTAKFCPECGSPRQS